MVLSADECGWQLVLDMPIGPAAGRLVVRKASFATFQWMVSSNPACRDSEQHLEMGNCSKPEQAQNFFSLCLADYRKVVSKQCISERDVARTTKCISCRLLKCNKT